MPSDGRSGAHRERGERRGLSVGRRWIPVLSAGGIESRDEHAGEKAV